MRAAPFQDRLPRQRPRLVLALSFLVLLPTLGCTQEKGLSSLRLPAGFAIEEFGKVPAARSMAVGEKGTLFVGTRRSDKVYALVDEDGDHKADKRYVLLEGQIMPNGVAFRDGALYVGARSQVLRLDDIESRLENPPKPVVLRDDLPQDKHHGWKFIRFGPDGKLYVPVGAPCNVCLKEDERYSSLLRMDADGSNLEVFAHGIRNTVGFDWHPTTGQAWFTDNGRDWLGDDSPPDELNRVEKAGQHFGFPFCHGGDIPDPEFGEQRPCAEFIPPAHGFQAHVAALGMRFYTGKAFPEPYRHQIFVAQHGSWNRSSPVGYKVALVRIDEAGKVLQEETFVEGWLQGDEPWGRPVDVQVWIDGSLLISDDASGTIYRVVYQGS